MEDALILAAAVKLLLEGRDGEARFELLGLPLADPAPVPPPIVNASSEVERSVKSRRPPVRPNDLALVLQRDGWQCQYCGRLLVAGGVLELIGVLCPKEFPFPPGHHMPADRTHPAANRVYPNVDHIHAGSRGGSWTDIANLVAACTPCNERKGNRMGWVPTVQEQNNWNGLVEFYRALAQRAGSTHGYHMTWFRALGI